MRIPVKVIRPEEFENGPRSDGPDEYNRAEKGVSSMADNQDVKQEEYEAYYEEPERPAEKEADAENWRDKYTRLLADFENYKRNAEKERGRLSGTGKEAVLEDVFPIVEHMERAIDSAKVEGGESGILKGLEMVYRELLSVLEKHGVERIQSTGEKFDPQLHEAVSVASSEEHPEGTVLEEVRPGFTRGGRLLRPAKVVVAR